MAKKRNQQTFEKRRKEEKRRRKQQEKRDRRLAKSAEGEENEFYEEPVEEKIETQLDVLGIDPLSRSKGRRQRAE